MFKQKKIIPLVIFLFFTFFVSPIIFASNQNSKIAELEARRSALLSERASVLSQLQALMGDDYTGMPPRNVVDQSKVKITQTSKDVQANMTYDEFGNPRAEFSQVKTLQQDSQKMRDLKNAPEYIQEGFNKTLHDNMYKPHDEQLTEYVKNKLNSEGMNISGDDVKIDDFRTPGKTGGINTDRDYRVLVNDRIPQYDSDGNILPKNKWKDNWVEVDRRKWEGKSQELFADVSGLKDSPEWKNAKTDAERQKLIKANHEKYQQMGTDKDHPEASKDYTDQEIGPDGKKRRLNEPNILKVKRGEATLNDPDDLKRMYDEKVNAAPNEAEAIAQSKKAVDSLEHIRGGYKKQGYDVKNLDPKLQKAMNVIKNATGDSSSNPAAVQKELEKLGFKGGVKEVVSKVGDEMVNLKDAKKTVLSKVKGEIIKKVGDPLKAGMKNLKQASDAHQKGKDVADVAVKSVRAVGLANDLRNENKSFDTMDKTVDRYNKKATEFYNRYESDPEFKKKFDSSGRKLPLRKMDKLDRSSVAEKMGIETAEDGLNYVQNLMNDAGALSTTINLVDRANKSNALTNVKGAFGAAAQKMGVAGATINTSKQVYTATKEGFKASEALEGEKKAVERANNQLSRFRDTQQRVQNDVAKKYNGNWDSYVKDRYSNYENLNPTQQRQLISKVKNSATKEVKDVKHIGWTTDDLDVLGSVDAGLTNAPVVGGVYSSVKSIGEAGYEGGRLVQAAANELSARRGTEYMENQIGNASNVPTSKLEQARANYRNRIGQFERGEDIKGSSLSERQLRERLAALDAEAERRN